MKLFCKHTWKILSEQTFESPFEHLVKHSRLTKLSGLSEESTHRKHVTIVTCEKCGSIKKFVELV